MEDSRRAISRYGIEGTLHTLHWEVGFADEGTEVASGGSRLGKDGRGIAEEADDGK